MRAHYFSVINVYIEIMKILFFTILFACFGINSLAQNTNISGIINSYATVSNISGNTLTISSSAGISAGDLILIIQMKGASMDESNTASFGDIISYNDAGNYEFLKVCAITSSTEIEVSNIQRTYSPSQLLQIVMVPVYDDATVTSTLLASPWNGTTGGILAFQCKGNLTMNADIDLQGDGFNGAVINTSSYSCQWFITVSDYFYDISTGEGALKGEGVSAYITTKTAGRGAQANGGGGGDDHNSGGGGGANSGNGGDGGERIGSSAFTCSGIAPGVGGKANIYSNVANKIFLGGGGGSGHENNPATASPGTNGGGIIIIIADTIIGNSQTIRAEGGLTSVAADGAGGGGAGGTILIDASTYLGTLNINNSGANGGDISNVGTSNCNGPGGGGGGGILWISNSTTPTALSLVNTGGSSGTTLVATQTNCTVGGTNNAQSGNNGIILNDLAMTMPLGSNGVEVISACDSLVWIDGITYYSDNNSAVYTIIGGSVSGCDSVVTLNLSLNSVDVSVTQSNETLTSNQNGASYQWLNCPSMSPLSGETNQSFTAISNGDYAVAVTNNGCTDTSACFSVLGLGTSSQDFTTTLQVYPNPTQGELLIDLGDFYEFVKVRLTDLSGRTIDSWSYTETKDFNIQIESVQGAYILVIEADLITTSFHLVKM
jgi:hypothetical protein